MKNKNSTKRALVASIMSLIVCVTMFVGVTFAWFTDSASTGVNKIQAGTLDVTLKYYNGTEWANAENEKLFDYDKWEPGYMAVQGLRVGNEGTLALKWKAMISSTENLSELANVIDVYVMAGETYSYVKPESREYVEENWTKAGTLAEFVSSLGTTTYGSLDANETADLGLALVMQTTAGNEYQGLDLGDVGLTILAIQDTVEADDFDNEYDAGSTYPVFSQEEFEEKLKVVTAGDTLSLASGTYVSPATFPKGVTITGDNGTVLDTNSWTNQVVMEEVTFNNITLKAGKYSRFAAKNIEFNGCTIDAVNGTYYSTVNGGDVVFENCTIKGSVYGLHIGEGTGNVIVRNCDLTGWNSFGNNGTVTIENTTFHKSSSGYGSLRFYQDGSVTDCTFDDDFIFMDIKKANAEVVVNNSTFNKDILFESTSSTGSKFIVDGTEYVAK